MFYLPHHVGMNKVDAAIGTLNDINPDVSVVGYNDDITSVDNYAKFIDILQSNDVDLVLGCVDNFQARITINQVYSLLYSS